MQKMEYCRISLVVESWEIRPQEGINLNLKISNDSIFRIAIARIQDNISVPFSLTDDEILENRSIID